MRISLMGKDYSAKVEDLPDGRFQCTTFDHRKQTACDTHDTEREATLAAISYIENKGGMK